MGLYLRFKRKMEGKAGEQKEIESVIQQHESIIHPWTFFSYEAKA